jgi:hypothetical protein
MPNISIADSPNMYTTSHNIAHPMGDAEKKMEGKMDKTGQEIPKQRAIARATDTGIYGFLLRAIPNILPLRSRLFGKTETRSPKQHGDERRYGPLRAEITRIAQNMSTVTTIPTATARDWLGHLPPTNCKITKSDIKIRAQIQIVLLTASHQMWLSRCNYSVTWD